MDLTGLRAPTAIWFETMQQGSRPATAHRHAALSGRGRSTMPAGIYARVSSERQERQQAIDS
jgi:hypothetical protein